MAQALFVGLYVYVHLMYRTCELAHTNTRARTNTHTHIANTFTYVHTVESTCSGVSSSSSEGPAGGLVFRVLVTGEDERRFTGQTTSGCRNLTPNHDPGLAAQCRNTQRVVRAKMCDILMERREESPTESGEICNNSKST